MLGLFVSKPFGVMEGDAVVAVLLMVVMCVCTYCMYRRTSTQDLK
jgi:hypothetical protein